MNAPITTDNSAKLSLVLKKMIDEKISRIILRNRNENPVGIITFGDLFNM
jgi:CBS domain-containing protein